MKEQRLPDRRLFVPPVAQNAVQGSLTFCPVCYPLLGLNGPQRHNGDLSRDFPGGDAIDLYEDDAKLLYVERLLKPVHGPTILQEWVQDNGRFVRCPRCRFQYLRRLRMADDVRVVFMPHFPDGMLPVWGTKEDTE
jgi:hypothetical protein